MSLETESLRREIAELRERLALVAPLPSLYETLRHGYAALAETSREMHTEQRVHVTALDRCADRLDKLEQVALTPDERDADPQPTEAQTISAIADWLERRATAIVEAAGGGTYTRAMADADQRAAGLTDAVDSLRAGTWRTP